MKHAYKCNENFCPNKVWIAGMNSLIWIWLYFLGLLYRVNGSTNATNVDTDTKLVSLFQAKYSISRKTLPTFQLQISTRIFGNDPKERKRKVSLLFRYYLICFKYASLYNLIKLQWNLSKADTYGTEVFVHFREVSALERFELKSSQI